MVGAWIPAMGHTWPLVRDYSNHGSPGTPGYMTADDWGDHFGKRSILFDGVNDHINTNKPVLPAQDYTLIMRCRITDITGHRGVWHQYSTGAGGGGLHVRVMKTTGKIRVDNSIFGVSTEYHYGTKAIPTGEWVHLCLTNQSAARWGHWLNGEEYYSKTGSFNANNTTNSFNFSGWAASSRMKGPVSEVYCYDRVLPDVQIKQLYHDGLAPFRINYQTATVKKSRRVTVSAESFKQLKATTPELLNVTQFTAQELHDLRLAAEALTESAQANAASLNELKTKTESLDG